MDSVSVQQGQPFYAQVAEALRTDIRAGAYKAGDQLPSERQLRERFDVSANTIRAALVALRTEGLVEPRHGRGVFVREAPQVQASATESVSFYTMLDRMGKRPATVTTVTRGPASNEVADYLGIPAGEQVVVRSRILRAEGEAPAGSAVSYFPTWVVDAAPALGDPNVPGLPVHLRTAFGPTYSEDLVDARMPTPAERERLEIPEGVPVLTVKGVTRDQQHRPLHFFDKVTPAGRMRCNYRFGDVPSDS
jgi:GntR family transcriptional regulator